MLDSIWQDMLSQCWAAEKSMQSFSFKSTHPHFSQPFFDRTIVRIKGTVNIWLDKSLKWVIDCEIDTWAEGPQINAAVVDIMSLCKIDDAILHSVCNFCIFTSIIIIIIPSMSPLAYFFARFFLSKDLFGILRLGRVLVVLKWVP